MVVNKLPNLKLFICGDGNDNQIRYVKELILKYNLINNVILHSYIEDNFTLIKNADILLIPSQNFESFGLTSIEAMALETLVITTNCGGLNDIIQNEFNGFIVSKDSPHDFAQAILKSYDLPLLKEKLVTQAKIDYNQNLAKFKSGSGGTNRKLAT